MMIRISRVELYQISIPLRFRYRHAAADHRVVESLICVARDSEGRRGVGEAVPRRYVTGETPESAFAAAEALAPRLFGSGEFDAEGLRSRALELALAEPGAPPSCAYCALDMAAHDLLGQDLGKPIHKLLASSTSRPLEYTASIGIAPKPLLRAMIAALRRFGFKRFKVKVGDADDIERVRFIRNRLGKATSIHADANMAWDREQAARKIEQLHRLDMWAIEEPLDRGVAKTAGAAGPSPHETLTDEHFASARWLRERSDLPIIADESLVSPQTARKIIATGSFDLFNVRLSKLGGFALALDAIEQARAARLRFGVGAMVAETSLLARAGTHLGTAAPGAVFMQGYSNSLLLKSDLVRPRAKLSFGARATCDTRPGLGVELDLKKLARHCTLKKVVEL